MGRGKYLHTETKCTRGQRLDALRAYLGAHRDRPVPAAELAEHLLYVGSHETRRRQVRRLVEEARNSAHALRICANGEGYWLARTAAEWDEYLESRRANARFEFVRVKRAREAVVNTYDGTGTLFERHDEGSREAWEAGTR